jgi:hypothetical protein
VTGVAKPGNEYSAQLQAPWFSCLQELIGTLQFDEVKCALVSVQHHLSAINNNDRVRFVEQSALPAGEAYEAFIFRTGQVPTRDNWHDLLNGLMWLSFPQAKRALNALQAAQIAQMVIEQQRGHVRGQVRDAATVFDENGAVLVTQSRALIAAWQAHDWQRLFIELRSEWQHAQLWCFGHALMEKLLTPYKAITCHALWCDAPHTLARPQLDEWLAAQLPGQLSTRAWTPLPVLGVPGWWAANEDARSQADFYADAAVFRPLRQSLKLESPI